MKKISVLCVNPDSVYKNFPHLDCWDKNRNAYSFKGTNPVITHAPCAQWSRLKAFAKVDKEEKELAWFCLNKVQVNGGIFEHPMGSSFFKAAKIPRSQIYSVDQHWWGFPCRKRTYLYFSQCKPLSFPMRLEAIEKRVDQLHYSRRSDTTLQFAQWLVACIENANHQTI